jgi:hypothetical protein
MSSRIADVIWPEDRSALLSDAYELRGKRGIELLLHMGSFDLWRGSLAQMRGDSPADVASAGKDGANAERFLQALAVSRAFDLITPRCAETIRLAYFDGRDVQQIAQTLETSTRYSATLVDNCMKRLFEVASIIYGELSCDDADDVEPETHPAIPSTARADRDTTPAERK